MGNKQLVCLLRQCCSTPVVFGQGFLSKKQCDNTGESHTFSDLAPADFFLFTRMKSSLKRRRFHDAAGITKNAKAELKRLSQNGFQECFQRLHSRWQKCVAAQGHFFEGNVA